MLRSMHLIILESGLGLNMIAFYDFLPPTSHTTSGTVRLQLVTLM